MRNVIIFVLTITVLFSDTFWCSRTVAQETSADSVLEPNEEAPLSPATTADTERSANTPDSVEENIVEEIKVVTDGKKKVMLNFKNATLSTILDHLSEVTGIVIVMDVAVEGRLTVISRQPLTLPEAITLINSVLIEKNYAAVMMGRTLKIVPVEQAKTMTIPVRQGGDPEAIIPSDEIVTHVIPIRFARADRLVQELSELLPPYANITSNRETNTLVITDTTANIRRMVEIVRAVDTQMSGVTDVKVFHLKYSDASNVANLINEIFRQDQRSSRSQDQSASPFERFMQFRGSSGGGPGGDRGRGDRGRGRGDDSSEGAIQTGINAAADTYTNTLVVTGPPDILRLVEDIIAEIDSNPLEEQAVLVYPLENAQAENVMEVLNNLFQQMQQMLMGGTTGGSGTRGGFGGFGGRGGFGSRGGSSGAGMRLTTTAGDLVGQVYFEADTDTNSILAIAASKHHPKIKELLKEMDKPVPQVLIKVLIAEVTHDGSLDLGLEFSQWNLRHDGSSTTIDTDFGIAAFSSGLVIHNIQGNLDVVLRALETEGRLNVLSRPYILASNNQAATITVGEEVPFIRDTRVTETGQTINTIEYEDIGIILEVTPSINPEGLVSMEIRPEISTTTAETVPISETVDAAVFAKRSAQSRVAIRDGETIVIGGLVQDHETESVDKVPILGDIPLLGLLFQRKQTTSRKTELLIFLTPHVALKDDKLKEITEKHNAQSKLFQNSSKFPSFEDHFEAMLLEEESKMVDKERKKESNN
jgi:general secretion pathway protein D